MVWGQRDRATSNIWPDKFLLKIYGYNLSIASFCSCFFISLASKTGQEFWFSDERKVLLLNSLNSGGSSKRFMSQLNLFPQEFNFISNESSPPGLFTFIRWSKSTIDTAKFKPSLEVLPKVFTPITSPFSFNKGPPLFPGLVVFILDYFCNVNSLFCISIE